VGGVEAAEANGCRRVLSDDRVMGYDAVQAVIEALKPKNVIHAGGPDENITFKLPDELEETKATRRA
jgi:hypothetical protein